MRRRHWFLVILVLAQVALVAQAQVHSLFTEGALDTQHPLDRFHPLSVGLVSRWKVLPGLDGIPRWYDLAATNHLTLTNMAAGATSGWKPTTRPGGQGQMTCDGTDDYLSIPSNSTFNLAQGSLVLWGLRRTAPGETVLVSLGDGTLADNYFALEWRDTTDVLRVVLSVAGANQWRADTSASFGVGRWWHLAVTVGSGGNAFYVNGTPQTLTYTHGSASSTQFLSSIFAAVATLDVCRLNFPGGPVLLPGAVDDLSLYNRALSAAEVREQYRLTQQESTDMLVRVPPPLPAYYAPAGFFPFFGQ